MSLLEKAMSAPGSKVSKGKAIYPETELRELGVAWLRGEVSAKQAGIALSKSAETSRQNIAYILAAAARRAVASGEYTLTKTEVQP